MKKVQKIKRKHFNFKYQVELSNGVKMPLVGFGTWKILGDEDIFMVIDAALSSGYRHFDTAVAYNNHRFQFMTFTHGCKQ